MNGSNEMRQTKALEDIARAAERTADHLNDVKFWLALQTGLAGLAILTIVGLLRFW